MKLALSYVSLSNVFMLIPFLLHARKIKRQLKSSECTMYKIQNTVLNHYTMSLWSSEEAMRRFSSSGAHLEAMLYIHRRRISKDEKFLTIDSTELLEWDVAKKLVKEKGKSPYK